MPDFVRVSVILQMEEEKSGFLKKLGFGKNASYAQHRDDINDEDRVITGTSYQVRYLGFCQVVDKLGTGSDHVESAMDKVYHESVKKGQKRKMRVRISVDRMLIEDISTSVTVIDIPLKRISYCSGSKKHPNLYCYIARAEGKDQFHAHVFMCDDVKTACDVVTILGTAFRMAYAKAKLNRNETKDNKINKSSHELTTTVDKIANNLLALSQDEARPRASSTSRIETKSAVIGQPPRLLPPPPPSTHGIPVRSRASTMPSAPNSSTASFSDDFTELARSRSSSSSNDQPANNFNNKANISSGNNINVGANLLIDLG